MEKGNEKPVKGILIGRDDFLEILMVAILLAFGVGIVASSITILENFNPLVGILIGIGVCLIAITYLVIRYKGNGKKMQTYNAFFVYNKDTKKVIEIPRYDFANQLFENLKSAFYENPALKSMWESDTLDNFYKFDKKKKKAYKRNPKSAKLLLEVVEYYILNKLSIHLTDYFNNDEFKEGELQTFQRNEIPDVLLSNRFLELFSKPMEERPCFVEHIEKDSGLSCVFASGSGDAIYEQFELVLPKKSTIKRSSDNHIQVNTNRFTMDIEVRFDGTSTNLPWGFREYYLDDNNWLNNIVYKVGVNITVRFNWLFIFSLRKWRYYSWIDSFLCSLDSEISSDKFFEKIDWNGVVTTLECLNSKQKITHENSNIEEEVR